MRAVEVAFLALYSNPCCPIPNIALVLNRVSKDRFGSRQVWRQLLHLKAPLDAADAGSEATVDAHRRVIKEDVPRQVRVQGVEGGVGATWRHGQPFLGHLSCWANKSKRSGEIRAWGRQTYWNVFCLQVASWVAARA